MKNANLEGCLDEQLHKIDELKHILDIKETQNAALLAELKKNFNGNDLRTITQNIDQLKTSKLNPSSSKKKERYQLLNSHWNQINQPKEVCFTANPQRKPT